MLCDSDNYHVDKVDEATVQMPGYNGNAPTASPSLMPVHSAHAESPLYILSGKASSNVIFPLPLN